MNIVYIDGPEEVRDGEVYYYAAAIDEVSGAEINCCQCNDHTSAWQAAWQLSDQCHAVEVVDNSTPY